MTETTASTSLGKLLAAISTRIVSLMREHYGRGPSRAKTYAIDDCLLCVLRDGLSAYERTIHETGGDVVAVRQDFQQRMEPRYRAAVEEITGRRVVAVLAQAHVEPDLIVISFFLDRPLEDAGTFELTHGGER
jgi:uncharacterized protein YbcI